MIYMIDHYDSFTYNIVQFLGERGEDITVRRNDAVRLNEIEALQPELILLSPGPRTPEQTGMTIEVIEKFTGIISILGVCRRHQSIVQVFSDDIVKTGKQKHGKTLQRRHDRTGIFRGMPLGTEVMNYHSLVVD